MGIEKKYKCDNHLGIVFATNISPVESLMVLCLTHLTTRQTFDYVFQMATLKEIVNAIKLRNNGLPENEKQCDE